MRKEDRKQIQGRASTTRSRVEMKATNFLLDYVKNFATIQPVYFDYISHPT